MFIYEAVADELKRSGVEAVFGLLGEDIAKLVVACEQRGIGYYAARHENQAVAMADGYARATGKIAVAAVTAGPGLTNALTAINTASRYGSKVVIIVGAGIGGAKSLSHPAICASVGVTSHSPGEPGEVMRDVRRSVHDARTGVANVLNLPSSLLELTWDPSLAHDEVLTPRKPTQPPAAAIQNVADLLEATWMASRPVVLAGRGAVLSDAGPTLRRLAERIGALLCTTLRAPALFRDDPYDLGVAGTYATPVASELLADADLVLAFGASMNKFTTYGGDLFPKAKFVQVDDVPEAFGVHVDVEDELRVLGDARLAAEAIETELVARGHAAEGYRTSATAKQLERFDLGATFSDLSTPGALDPRTLAMRLDVALPADRVVVVDGGHNSAFWIPYLQVRDGADFLQTSYVGGAGSIGLSIGEAIGAAVGREGTLVAACMGDAGHMMALGDVETAVRYQLPIVMLVSNDRALGAEIHYLSLVGMPTDIAKIDTPSLAAVAEAMGAEGYSVSSLTDLEEVEQRLARPVTGPIVIDCHIDPTVRAEWIELVWGDRVRTTP